MINLSMLDVAIGLVVVYLVLSLLCSSVNEGLETFLKNRSRQLERGIREMLNDPDGNRVTHLLYNHPLITGLFQGDYEPSKLKEVFSRRGKFYAGTNLPSYIPATNFALAIMDIILPGTGKHVGGAASSLALPGNISPGDLAQTFRQAAMNFPVPAVGRALVILIDASANDLVQVRRAIEEWFDSGMDRVSGWYKRRIQLILFAIALTASVTLNIDTIHIVDRLEADPSVRNALVATAQEYAKSGVTQSGEKSVEQLKEIGVPIGWKELPSGPYPWFLKVLGILASALAATLGAPFWFDMLNRFVVIRSTIKPQEKSRPERSKD